MTTPRKSNNWPDIRLARKEDVQGIAECLANAFEPYRTVYTANAFSHTVLSAEALRERLAHMMIYVAIGSDGQIAATVAAASANLQGHLRGMAVRPECQGKGIAAQLLSAAERGLREAGCTQVTLGTTEPLQKAIRLYEKHGFTRSSNVQDFYGMRLYEYVKTLA